MKLVAEYLERATQFERMADEATDPHLKDQLVQQGQAYRKLAAKRAVHLKAAPPDRSTPGA